MMPEDRAARVAHRILSPQSSWEQFGGEISHAWFGSGGGSGDRPAHRNGLESASQRPLHNLEIVILYRQHVWLQSVVH
jgi:hypothetical protein